MSDAYEPLVLPLTGGLDEATPALVGGADFDSASNVDFGFKGQVRGRPSATTHDGFRTTQFGPTGVLNAQGATSNWNALAAGAKVNPVMVPIRDRLGDAPGLVGGGRSWFRSADGTWYDAVGPGSMRVRRLVEFQDGRSFLVANLGARAAVPGVAVTVGAVAGGAVAMLGTEYRQIGRETFSSATVTGGAAVTSAGVEALLMQSGATLSVLVGTVGSGVYTIHTVATDAATPIYSGDCPCICADYDTANFYVAYLSTTAHTVGLAQVSPAGAVVNSTSFTFGAGTLSGVWLTNSTVATDVVIVGCTDGTTQGVFTAVRAMTNVNLTNAIDATVANTTATIGQVVLGCAGANVWVVFKDTAGQVELWTRSTTTTTVTHVLDLRGQAPQGIANPFPLGVVQGRSIWITHQPVDVNGRVVLGLAFSNWWPNDQWQYGPVCTWYEFDVGDLWISPTTTGRYYVPQVVAQGPLDATIPSMQPVSALLTTRGTDQATFVFQSQDYGTVNAVAGMASGNAIGPYAGQSGTGSLGLNEVALFTPQYATAGSATVVGGSVPKQFSGGVLRSVGFPVCRPTLKAAAGAAGTWNGANYSFYAVWRCTDPAGFTYQSEPSAVVSGINLASVEANLVFDMPLTDVQLDTNVTAWMDVYANDGNGGPTFWLQASFAFPVRGGGSQSASVHAPVTSGLTKTLYIDGGVAPNQAVRADGGIVTVANRTWTSDGRSVYASKLPLYGQGVAWSTIDALTVDLPVTAGRVVALGGIDDKLIVGCERGVYAVTGDGPDNLGQGAQFSPAVKISSLGVNGPRAVASVPGVGVFFIAAFTNVAHPNIGGGQYDGLYLVGRDLTVKRVSWPVQQELQAGATEVVHLAEREALFVNLGNGAIVVLDMRANLWGVWTHPDGTPTLAVVGGVLWGGPGATAPAAYDGTPGSDTIAGVSTPYTMSVRTSHLRANGKDPLGWARVRSLRVLGERQANTITYTALQDQTISNSKAFTETFTGLTTWPTDRYAPEWRLPQQKCSTIQVTLSATPATAAWTHLELRVMPLGRAPSFQRG